MKKLANILTVVSFALNLPAMGIWTIVALRSANYAIGESMAIWLSANFSILSVLVLWLVLPSMALIFGLGSYAMEGKKVATIVVIVLSTTLLLSLALGSAAITN